MGGIGFWRFTTAGLCASLVGIGIGRFAYTPLIPALISAKWFSPSDVLYLGAANLAGYLLGALVARPAAARIAPVTLLRGSMLLATVACFACATPLSLPWFFCWRLAAGISGGVIMVLVAAAILPHAPRHRHGSVGGIVFTGVGLGVAASGTLVPLLLRSGLVTTWCVLGALSAVLTLVSWFNWPVGEPPNAPASAPRVPVGKPPLAINALVVEYGLYAAAQVPPMIFLVDFVARGLHQGLTAGAHFWVLYGIGAMAGPLLAGLVADRLGFGRALRLAYFIEALAVALPAVTVHPAALIVSSMLAGALTPGIVPLVLGRVHELLPRDTNAQGKSWSRTTASFALCQAGAAYGCSFIFDRTGGDYTLLFALGSLLVTLALLLDLAMTIGGRVRH